MPLIFNENISDDAFWGIWEIRETAEELLERYNSSAEESFRQYADSEKIHPGRISSRLLIKELMKQRDIEHGALLFDESGCPCFKNPDYFISLSHSGAYSVAIIHRKNKVGIDIELIREKLVKVSDKYLSEKEKPDAGQDLKKLAVYWCAKETLYKIYSRKQLSLKNDLFIHPFEIKGQGICTGEILKAGAANVYRIKYLEYNGYIITYNL